jgi:hypothetical protein
MYSSRSMCTPVSRSFWMRSIITICACLSASIEVPLDGDAGAEFLGYLGQQRGRPAQDDTGAQPGQQERIGAGHPGVQNIAHNRHRNPGSRVSPGRPLRPAQGAEHGSQVQQGLGGMLVHAIPGIQHRQPVAWARR